MRVDRAAKLVSGAVWVGAVTLLLTYFLPQSPAVNSDQPQPALPLALAAAPPLPPLPALPAPQITSNADLLTGVTVTDLDPASRRLLKVPSQASGALVGSVDYSSLAYASGMRAGDVIVEINRQPVANSSEAVDISKKITGDDLLLRVCRDGKNRFLLINGANPAPQPSLISFSQ
jgi:NADPH-dependent 2,4-dienoyl-CoA reductase/sulfur reductase-like enzyme